MISQITNASDIEALSDKWSDEREVDESRRIKRIEDLPPLEQVGALEIDWVVDGIIAEGALHMLTSESGAGKSTLISAVAYAISRGSKFLGRNTARHPVLLLDAENPGCVVVERFGRLRIKPHNDFRVWGQWCKEDPPGSGDARVLEWVARCDPKPVIIFDSVIAFHPGDENNANETRRYMAQYRKLTAMGATVIVLHHTGKSETSQEYRGSSDYKASIDIGYKLTNSDPARLSRLELAPFKQRFSVAPILHLRYEDGIFSIDQSEIRKTAHEQLADLLKQNPGITKKEFDLLAVKRKLGRNRARSFLDKGVKNGTIRVEPGTNNRQLHSWAEEDTSLPPDEEPADGGADA
jgi:hypothetical protein